MRIEIISMTVVMCCIKVVRTLFGLYPTHKFITTCNWYMPNEISNTNYMCTIC